MKYYPALLSTIIWNPNHMLVYAMELSDRIQYYELLSSTPWYYYLQAKSNFRVEIMRLHFMLLCIESILRKIKISSIYQNDIDWFIQKLWKLSTDRWVGHDDEKTWTRVGIWPNKGKLDNTSNQTFEHSKWIIQSLWWK